MRHATGVTHCIADIGLCVQALQGSVELVSIHRVDKQYVSITAHRTHILDARADLFLHLVHERLYRRGWCFPADDNAGRFRVVVLSV